MPRAKRTVIDTGFPLVNVGFEWDARDVALTFSSEPVAPEDDWLVVSVPTVFGSHGAQATQVTVWGHGLVSLGAPTAAQTTYMATLASLPAGADLTAFLAAFPGDFIDIGFQQAAYGQLEEGTMRRDPVADPFGSFQDPAVIPDGHTIYRTDQAKTYVHVGVDGDVYDGTPDDWDFLIPQFGADHGLEFSEEGFLLSHGGGAVHFGGGTLAVGADGYVYYSDLNVVTLGGSADMASVAGGPEALLGMGGDDRLTGGAYADRLDGGAGNDVLVGGGGVDRLFGGAGNDDLSDGDERGTLDGGAGNDVLRPGLGEDTIDGGDGVDRLVADYSAWTDAITLVFDPAVADYLFPDAYKRVTGVEAISFTAGAGRDTIEAAGGDDVLVGGGGADLLSGGAGDDRLFGGDARDRLEGGDGDDMLNGGAGSGPDELDSSGSPQYDLNATPELLLHVTQVDQGFIGGTQVYGWTPEFRFTVTDAATQRVTLDLSEITGGGPILAGYSVTLYRVEDNGDFTQLSYDDDPGGDSLTLSVADAGRYAVTISSLDDDPANLTVGVRLSGVPVFDGDTMIGGLGDDTYFVNSRDDQVIEAAGEGFDTVVTALAVYSLAALPAVEGLTGSTRAQRLIGNAAANVIVGGGGADTLIGGGGDDRLILAGTPAAVAGGGGRDQLIVAAGATVALTAAMVSGIESCAVQDGGTLDLSRFTGPGLQIASLSSAGQRAIIVGGVGADRITGGDGADRLMGGGGDDAIRIDHQTVSVNGGVGVDSLTIAGTAGQRFVFGAGQLTNIETVTVTGGVRVDMTGVAVAPGGVFVQGAGATVLGSNGADHIHGGAGADVLAGGLGQDVLSGGGGADRFVVTVAEGTAARDQIADFTHAQGDRIDLSPLSAQPFTFLGAAAFSGSAATGPEVRAVANAGGAYLVQVDLDHDGKADAQLLVHAHAPLIASDFGI